MEKLVGINGLAAIRDAIKNVYFYDAETTIEGIKNYVSSENKKFYVFNSGALDYSLSDRTSQLLSDYYDDINVVDANFKSNGLSLSFGTGDWLILFDKNMDVIGVEYSHWMASNSLFKNGDLFIDLKGGLYYSRIFVKPYFIALGANDNTRVPSTTTHNIVYGTNNSGALQNIPYSNDKIGNTIPLRDSSGRFKINTPDNDYDAANKKYVDDLVSDLIVNSFTLVDISVYPTLEQFLASTGQEGYIYLYPVKTSESPTFESGYYEYIYENNDWLLLGTTKIDLSNYYTIGEVNGLLDDKADKVGPLPSLSANYDTNVWTFIQTNNLDRKAFVLNYGSEKFIGTFNVSGPTDVYFEIESLAGTTRYTSLHLDVSNLSFWNILSDTYREDYALEADLETKADKVGPLPKMSVLATDSVYDFVINNSLLGESLILHITDRGAEYIGWFVISFGKLYFEFEAVGSSKRFYGQNINQPSITFANIVDGDTYREDYEIVKNKVTTLSGSSTDTEYPSAKAVWDNLKNVREVAEGKCKAYVITYTETDVTQATFSSNHFRRVDGTIIATWSDFVDYVTNGGGHRTYYCANSDFNDDSAQDIQFDTTLNNAYIITKDYMIVRLWYTGDGANEGDLSLGDVIFVLEPEVPDRWVAQEAAGLSVNGAPLLYGLESEKVDLTSYYTKTEADNKFVAKTTTIAGVDLADNITAQELSNALVFATNAEIESIMEDE